MATPTQIPMFQPGHSGIPAALNANGQVPQALVRPVQGCDGGAFKMACAAYHAPVATGIAAKPGR
jgi:hypothetical protein